LTGIIYVSTPPEICQERIHQRGRKGEDAIPIEYLNNLDKYQKQWLYKENTLEIFDYKNYGESLTSVKDVEAYIEDRSAAAENSQKAKDILYSA
jgi:deoxyadenosine/deoxycytidine kinase